MPPRFIYPIRQTKQYFATGHRICARYPVNNLGAKLSWPLRAVFSTKCSIKPSEVELEVIHNHVPVSGDVIIPFVITSRDSNVHPVSTSLLVVIRDAADRIIYQPASIFQKNDLMPGETERGNFTSTITQQETRAKFNDEIIVYFEFTVFGCHDDPDAPIDQVAPISCSKL